MNRAGELFCENCEESHEVIRKWLVVHHHVVPVSSATIDEARKREVSVLANAPEVLKRAQQWGVELILHGHQHQPCVIVEQRWIGESEDLEFQPVAVVGAGSCGARRTTLGPMARNHYFILIRRDKEIIVRSRAIGEEGLRFMNHNDLAIDAV